MIMATKPSAEDAKCNRHLFANYGDHNKNANARKTNQHPTILAYETRIRRRLAETKWNKYVRRRFYIQLTKNKDQSPKIKPPQTQANESILTMAHVYTMDMSGELTPATLHRLPHKRVTCSHRCTSGKLTPVHTEPPSRGPHRTDFKQYLNYTKNIRYERTLYNGKPQPTHFHNAVHVRGKAAANQ